MFHHILVPLDGSSRAEQALPVAAQIARASHGMLTLLSVITPRLEVDLKPMGLSRHIDLSQEVDMARANDYLAQVTSSNDFKGIDIRTEVLTGAPATTIRLFAQLQRVDLIVMCSHGYTGFKRWRLGSVALHVIQRSPAPVLVLCEGGSRPIGQPEESTRPLRVLVALDGSPLAETALVPAAHLCACLAAPAQGALHLIRVLPFSELADDGQKEILLEARKLAEPNVRAYLDTIEQRLREGDLAKLGLIVTSSVVVHTDVADTLIRVAEHGEFVRDTEEFGGCDLIAMATHGRGDPHRWFMGSITEHVLGTTALPLLVVRPHQSQTEEYTSATAMAMAGKE
jgi:nucleotide-binding universal stress UspA family protein